MIVALSTSVNQRAIQLVKLFGLRGEIMWSTTESKVQNESGIYLSSLCGLRKVNGCFQAHCKTWMRMHLYFERSKCDFQAHCKTWMRMHLYFKRSKCESRGGPFICVELAEYGFYVAELLSMNVWGQHDNIPHLANVDPMDLVVSHSNMLGEGATKSMSAFGRHEVLWYCHDTSLLLNSWIELQGS